MDRILPRRFWPGLTLLDGFLGGGSVSLYAKAVGFKVVACDIAERAIVVGAGAGRQLTRAAHPRGRLEVGLHARTGRGLGRIEARYSPSTFTPVQARFLDRALTIAAGTPDRAKAALYRLLAICVVLLAHPMSQVRAGTIHRVTAGEFENITESRVRHYVDGLRLTRPAKLWELAQAINAGVFQGEATVLKRSVLDVLPDIRDKQTVLPRRLPIVEEFARPLAADAKVLDEDPETGAKKYRYARTGENHYSLAFTYALMASNRYRLRSCPVVFL